MKWKWLIFFAIVWHLPFNDIFGQGYVLQTTSGGVRLADGVIQQAKIAGLVDSIAAHLLAIQGKQASGSYVTQTTTVNGHALSGNVSVTTTDLSLQNVTNTSDANKPVSTAQQTALDLKANLASPTFTGTVAGVTASMVGLGSVNNTSDAGKPVSTAQQTALDLKANLASPTFTGTVTLPSGQALIAPALGTPASGTLTNCTFPVITAASGGTGINNSTRTLTISTNAGTIAFPGSSTTQTYPTNTAQLSGVVATANVAAGTSAVSATTLFTPTVSGWYRISAFLKITTTGTSPVAGPVTITYTDPDGSVAQSEVMLLHSVTGTVVTTTVNNSTTTGTVSGTLVIYAKTGVAIQYAIAVSGTYGAGRYTAHLACESLQ